MVRVCGGSGGRASLPTARLDPVLPGPLQMVSNPSLITKQMLTFYSANSDQGRELTRHWDRIMIEVGEGPQCWGFGAGGKSGALTTEVVRAPMMPTGK